MGCVCGCIAGWREKGCRVSIYPATFLWGLQLTNYRWVWGRVCEGSEQVIFSFFFFFLCGLWFEKKEENKGDRILCRLGPLCWSSDSYFILFFCLLTVWGLLHYVGFMWGLAPTLDGRECNKMRLRIGRASHSCMTGQANVKCSYISFEYLINGLKWAKITRSILNILCRYQLTSKFFNFINIVLNLCAKFQYNPFGLFSPEIIDGLVIINRSTWHTVTSTISSGPKGLYWNFV